nr:hypothetical protein pmam_357 [Pithovirus mammoth]
MQILYFDIEIRNDQIEVIEFYMMLQKSNLGFSIL